MTENKVTWTPSADFEEFVDSTMADTSDVVSHKSKTYRKGQDIDDDVVFSLEENLRLYELSRSYRRARAQQMYIVR